MVARRSLALCAAILLGLNMGVSDAGEGKVLVLIENIPFSSTYSQYLDNIRELGYSIEQRSVSDPTLHLREWDEWLYSKLIIFASGTKGFGGAVDNEAILDFVDAGHDVILAVDSQVSEELRNLAADLGVDLEASGSAVLDYSDYALLSKAADPTLVASTQVTDLASVMGPSKLKDPILFRGIGATFSPGNPQVLQALGGEVTHVMGVPGEGISGVQKVGKGISLVTLVQTRNDARVVVAGSLQLFTNAFLQAKDFSTARGSKFARAGNAEFLAEVSRWAFHERSRLRAGNLRHHPPGTSQQPDRYRITDDIEFELDIHEYSYSRWLPYNASDVQLEFVMLDPYIRTFLKHDGTGRYFASFKAPDVYGVFKFVVDYKRPGLTPIELSHQISVRHFRHNEFERFIPAAFPYYASAFSCMAAFLIFSFVFLYHREKSD